MKALYDAVGSSIKIPNNGTKTLKLRLSVGQDSAQGQGAETTLTDKNEKESPKKKDVLKNKENVKHKDSPKTRKKDITKLNNLTSTQPPLAKCSNETAGQSAAVSAAASAAAKSRLSTKEHQELAELVQENMERNHIRQLR